MIINIIILYNNISVKNFRECTEKNIQIINTPLKTVKYLGQGSIKQRRTCGLQL